jgi:hypothetical protein
MQSRQPWWPRIIAQLSSALAPGMYDIADPTDAAVAAFPARVTGTALPRCSRPVPSCGEGAWPRWGASLSPRPLAGS